MTPRSEPSAATPLCPMCGGVRTDATRCLSCGESFPRTIPRRWLPIGLLPGAIVGALAGLFVAVILRIVERPNEFGQSIVGSLLCVLIGTVGGLGRVAVVRAISRSGSDPTAAAPPGHGGTIRR
jgi:hypothetical protein